MGRRAYLTRLALVSTHQIAFRLKIDKCRKGRSAFDPPERHNEVPSTAEALGATNNDENAIDKGDAHFGREPANHMNATQVQAVQSYDNRGRPVNSKSREFSRSLRRAQNEVLSIVGVCARNIPKPEDTVTAANFEPDIEVLRSIARENMYGIVLRLSVAVGQILLAWWIEPLRQRLLVSLMIIIDAFSGLIMLQVFEVPREIYFTELLAIQGRSMELCHILIGCFSDLILIIFNEGGPISRELMGRVDKELVTESKLPFKLRARLHSLVPTFEKL